MRIASDGTPDPEGRVSFHFSEWITFTFSFTGSGRKLTNTSGAVVYRGEFDPHGQALYEWQSSGQTYLNSHKFTGYERDWATNLNYAKARTYVHNRGRFMQPDPLGLGAADVTNPQSLNRYSYVGNDPVNFVDPLGLMFCFARFLISSTYENGHLVSETWEFLGIFCYGDFGGGGGGGGDPSTPGEPQQQQQDNRTLCERFVDTLVDLVVNNNDLSALGGRLQMDAVNDIQAGYGKDIIPHDDQTGGGFQRKLWQNGQRGDLFRHIMFVAGGVLIGSDTGLDGEARRANEMFLSAFHVVDKLQAWWYGPESEKASEYQGNLTGFQVGKSMIKAYGAGRTPEALDKLRQELRSAMCAN